MGIFSCSKYQILRTNIMKIEWKTVGRIINEILRVKGLGVQSRSGAGKRAATQFLIKNWITDRVERRPVSLSFLEFLILRWSHSKLDYGCAEERTKIEDIIWINFEYEYTFLSLCASTLS